MKRNHIFLAMLFVLPILVLSVLSFILTKPTESKEEKRVFKLPEFSLSALVSGEYTKGLENYYSDTFPFRSFFIGADNALQSALRFRGADGDMIYRTDGGAELGSGENLFDEAASTPAPTVDPDAPPTPVPIEINTAVEDKGAIIISDNRAMETFFGNEEGEAVYGQLLRKLAGKVTGAKVYSMVVPTSIEFYSPEKYHTMTRSQKDAIDRIYASAPEVTPVDAYGWIAAATDKYIYFRSDHHWTARGAYAAYTAFCKAAGIVPVGLEQMETATVPGFLGTLYTATKSASLANTPDEVEVFYPIYEYVCNAYQSSDMTAQGIDVKAIYRQLDSTPNKYLAFFGGDHAVLRAVTQNKNGRKVLMIKDSFGNAFGVFLLNNFEEVYLIDPRKVTLDLPKFIAENGITDVLVENYAFAVGNKDILNGINNLIGQ